MVGGCSFVSIRNRRGDVRVHCVFQRRGAAAVRLTCILDKVLVELWTVPVLWDVAYEEPVVVVRYRHSHLPALPDLGTVELIFSFFFFI